MFSYFWKNENNNNNNNAKVATSVVPAGSESFNLANVAKVAPFILPTVSESANPSVDSVYDTSTLAALRKSISDDTQKDDEKKNNVTSPQTQPMSSEPKKSPKSRRPILLSKILNTDSYFKNECEFFCRSKGGYLYEIVLFGVLPEKLKLVKSCHIKVGDHWFPLKQSENRKDGAWYLDEASPDIILAVSSLIEKQHQQRQHQSEEDLMPQPFDPRLGLYCCDNTSVRFQFEDELKWNGIISGKYVVRYFDNDIEQQIQYFTMETLVEKKRVDTSCFSFPTSSIIIHNLPPDVVASFLVDKFKVCQTTSYGENVLNFNSEDPNCLYDLKMFQDIAKDSRFVLSEDQEKKCLNLSRVETSELIFSRPLTAEEFHDIWIQQFYYNIIGQNESSHFFCFSN